VRLAAFDVHVLRVDGPVPGRVAASELAQ
jgi:hypothetical protein